jgi:hypothetical protein
MTSELFEAHLPEMTFLLFRDAQPRPLVGHLDLSGVLGRQVGTVT